MERDIHLHLSFSCEPRALRPWMAAALLLLAAGDLASESVTLTTYYPAPSGVYTQMITTGQTLLARDGSGRVGIGLGSAGVPTRRLDVTGYFSDSSAARITSGPSTSGLEIDVSAMMTSPYYALIVHGTSPYLYVRSDGFVGVGTTSPVSTSSKLDVNGKIYGNVNLNIGSTISGASETRPYLRIENSGGSCSNSTTNGGTCAGYITWAQGVFIQNGWWSAGPNITNTTVNTTIGPQYSVVTTAPRYFCCQR